jgi:oligopeptide transport system substrate-binding protein
MPQVSADGRTLTFMLREGVTFVSRDGSVLRQMTADDVAYSLNRLLNPNLTPTPSPVGETFFALIVGAGEVLAGQTDSASGIRILDESTIEIEIAEADPTFLNVLAMPFASVVPRELAGTDTSAFSLDPVGTGPYLLVEWTPAQRALFTRNPHYWDAAFAGAPEIEVRLGLDPDSQLQQVQTGVLHIQTDNITPGQYTATINDPRWADYLQLTDTLGVNYVTLDTSTEGPLNNVLVRRAISHAIDKANIVRINNNRNTAAGCFYPPGLPGHDPSCETYPYDPDRARELLREAGHEGGFSTTLYTFDVDPGPQYAQAIQQDLADVGISTEIVLQPFDTLLETIFVQGQAPMVMIGWIADFPDPSNFIEPIITCAAMEAGFNISWYCNEEVDRLVAEAKRQSGEERIRTYEQIEDIVMQDAPWVPVEYPGLQVLVHPTVDFHFHPVWQFDYARYTVRN